SAVLAYTGLGQAWAERDAARAQAAFAAAADRVDGLELWGPAADLAAAWAAVDLDQAVALAERIEGAAERGAALRSLSAMAYTQDATRGKELFGKALAASEQAWVLGDPFASAEALRALGAAWSDLDATLAGQAFAQAHAAALAVPSGK
ncbi:MAG: hypothetical protein GX605_13335, partial [Chloroflexi bacterium]|nr:hypothetical protein [Chloroflexota bacterium]